MKRFATLFFSLVLPCLLTLCWFTTAKGDGVVFQRQTIQNKTGVEVNDATVDLSVDVEKGMATNAQDQSKKANGVVDKRTIIFAPGVFGTLKDGEKLFIDYGPINRGTIIGGQWTSFGQNVGVITTLGANTYRFLNKTSARHLF